ncbi:gamma-glutamylcyclotransferase [Thalassospira sp. MCCC 1A01428]|uniref:gamma-glutamylcyclotransferase n=1 Tax=Thalassospira sp. MCCC 1A01428 TaxID=1470575 RepID=UPI000A1FBAB9|nr:gamma-glutamylcyclotransferase [Thalassospira sp. MCCC 1A01428]OSQ46322.1 gamma-glutamyl cyclotransferase [Thalassospira sp. MCCC 1A01428]
MTGESGHDDKWVFGYGSLLWRPGFTCEERAQALLRDYHRSFCIYSHHYRGTPENPGLVLGLSAGGQCHGMAFRVKPENWPMVKAYLDERELVTNTYIPADVDVELADGRHVIAHTYVADPAHPQYAGNLPMREAAEIITAAYGNVGPNLEYLENTVCHLDQMGIVDPPLHDLMDLVRREYGQLNMGAGI